MPFLKTMNSTDMAHFTVHLQEIAVESAVFNFYIPHHSSLFTGLASVAAAKNKRAGRRPKTIHVFFNSSPLYT